MRWHHLLSLALGLISLSGFAAQPSRVQLEIYPGLLLHRVDGKVVNAYRAFTPSRKILQRHRGLRLMARNFQAPSKAYAPTTGKIPLSMDWSLQFPVPKTSFGLGYVYVAALESSHFPHLLYKNDVPQRAIRILPHHAQALRESVIVPSKRSYEYPSITSEVSLQLVYAGGPLNLSDEESALVARALQRDEAWLRQTLRSD